MAGKKKQSRRPPAGRPAVKRPSGAPKAPAGAAPPASATPPRKTQAERLDAARRARARKSRNVRLGLIGGVLLLVGLLVVNTLDNRSDSNALRSRLTAGGCSFDTRSDPTSAGAANHTPPAGYEVDPPAGGNHDPQPAGAGTYTEANSPSDQKIVHSLEHGYIAVWYQPGLGEETMAALTDAISPTARDVLLVPRASLTGEVAATAWGERLLCPTVEAGPLREFIDAYRNKGPERVEHPPI